MRWLCVVCGNPVVAGSSSVCMHASTGDGIVGVAHNTPDIAAQIELTLKAAGFCAVRPERTLEHAYGQPPTMGIDALILDVAYSSPPAFLLIETIRASDRADLPVMLVSSVYSKTAYKRRPTSLYGADDYVEQHHIPDMLPQKLSRLLRSAQSPTETRTFDEAQLSRIKQAADRMDLSPHVRIQTLAKAIVADIALYHQSDVEQAVRHGDLGPLQATVHEGRKVLERLMGTVDIAHTAIDPVGDAFTELIEGMRDAKIAEVS